MMMLDIEEIMCELEGAGEDQLAGGGGGGSLMPPGFRFHPTDEELITYYLASKVFINDTYNLSAAVDIPQVDLNRCEPWELPDVAKMGEGEWYFYSMRDRKYPTGLRTNRATGAGYWKATGKDKEVYSSSGSGSVSGGSGKGLLGMKKTLVFYKGRAPRGEKTKWVMHEYRLDGDFSCRHTCKEEWVICRIFHKMGEKKHGGFIMNTTNIHEGQSLYHHQHQLQEEEQHPPHPSSPTTTTTNSLPAVVPLLESTTTPSLSSLLLESPNPATIPPPLMMLQQQHIQNPNFLFQHHHENDLRSLITSPLPSLFPTITGCCFQTNDPSPKSNITNSSIINITPTIDNKNNTETNASPSPSSSLLRSLLSNQDYFTSTTIPKQCKTEAIFSQIDHLPLPDHHSSLGNNWGGLDKTNPTHQITYSSFFASSSCQYPISNLGVDFRVNATVGFPSSLLAEGVGTKLAGGGTTTTTTSSLAFNKSGFSRCPWI